MRGAFLSMAVLSLVIPATAATTLAQAETPPIGAFRAVPSSRVAIPVTPRPPMPPSVLPRMVLTRTSTPLRTPITARTPHCPNPPPKPPLSVSIPKQDHNKRTMALIQQNIVMMSILRAQEPRRPCDPSWSAKKLARKGCPPAGPTPQPVLELAPPPPPLASETVIAAAPEAIEGQN
jgi:hypothetical protein